MKIGVTRDPRGLFIEPRVVLHRARTERIHAEVDRIIPRGHPRKMPNDIYLGNFGHSIEIVVASQFCWNDAVDTYRIDVEFRQVVTYAAGLRTLKYQPLVLCRMLCNFGD